MADSQTKCPPLTHARGEEVATTEQELRELLTRDYGEMIDLDDTCDYLNKPFLDEYHILGNQNYKDYARLTHAKYLCAEDHLKIIQEKLRQELGEDEQYIKDYANNTQNH